MAVQMLLQAPPAQVCPAAQLTPQAPQFWRSLAVDTQVPPQAWVVPAHTHLPPVQWVPVTHATAHAPQFLSSLATLMQAPPQAAWLAAQVATHVPSEHF